MLPRVRPMVSAASLVRLQVPLALGLLCLLAACTSGYGPTTHRHGGAFVGPARYYPPPGPAEDPWGPYIREASGRYGVPEQWIREVMRQESGGQEQAVSSAGAMGLMQIMPDTFDGLRQRYALGNDPFEPRDNIMAGTAYIREMYDRYGAPGFLAAYNAGPSRLDSYLVGGDSLPDETVNYVAAIAPRLGRSVALTGPLAAYGQVSNVAQAPPVPIGRAAASVTVVSNAGGACDQDAAYDPDRPCAPGPTLVATAPAVATTGGGCDPDAAYDPTRACQQAAAPAALGVPVAAVSQTSLYQPAAPAAVISPPATSTSQAMASATARGGGWAIQVGAFRSPAVAREAATGVHDAIPDLLSTAQIELLPTTPFGGAVVYRARLGNLSSATASAACARLAAAQRPCIVVGPGQTS
jgi:D-alanyl-D-alanine carboxypeptidase